MDKLFHRALDRRLGDLQDLDLLGVEIPHDERPKVFWIPAVLPADICVNWNSCPAIFRTNRLLTFRPVLPAQHRRTQDTKLVRTLLELHVTAARTLWYFVSFW